MRQQFKSDSNVWKIKTNNSDTQGLTLVLLSYFNSIFRHLKLQLLTQYPSSINIYQGRAQGGGRGVRGVLNPSPFELHIFKIFQGYFSKFYLLTPPPLDEKLRTPMFIFQIELFD